MSFDDAQLIIDHLKSNDFDKISFAGGEPLLIDWIFDIIGYAKSKGFVTELITNGSLLGENQIEKYSNIMDILTIDVDTVDEQLCYEMGKGKNHVYRAERLFKAAINTGMLCKINTVITRLNKNSVLDLCDWVKNIGGIYRWKIFQFLPSIGTAKLNSNKLALEIEEFNSIKGNIRDSMQRWSGQLIFEDINFLSNSYISIDPHGNFYTAIKKDNEYRIVVLGHVLDMSIEQLINHPLLNKDNLVARCQFNSNYFKTINKI